MINKRGQGLSTNAIILIILGVIVLAVLIIGFTMGWNTLAPWISSGNENVQTVVTACSLACTTDNVYDYCTKTRELKADDLPGNQDSVTNTCEYFANTEGYESYGIAACSGLCSQ